MGSLMPRRRLPPPVLPGLNSGLVQALDLEHLVERVEEDIEHHGIELRAAQQAHLGDRVGDRERRAVDPVARQRVEDVGHGRDPSSTGMFDPARPRG